MDIRSVLPSQLIAESGSDIVVINLGSANVRVGLATGQSPVVVPHCIAHQLVSSKGEAREDEPRRKGSVAEQVFAANSLSDARKAERDEICKKVESQLKMRPFISDSGGSPKGHGEEWPSSELQEDESFTWTQVMEENPAFQANAAVSEPLISTESATENGQHSSPAILSEPGGAQELEQKTDEEPKLEIPEDPPLGIPEDPQQDSKELNGTELEEEIVEDTMDGEKVRLDEEMAIDSEAAPKGAEEVILDLETEPPKESNGGNLDAADEQVLDEPQQENVIEPKREVHEGPDLEIHVEVPLEAEDSSAVGSLPQQKQEEPDQKPLRYRKYICGQEALNIAANEPYILRRPICRGHLNVSPRYSLQQVCDDIYTIWDWVLTKELFLGSEGRQQFSVVLVVPDTFDNREIKELLTVVLKELRFRSAVVHQESVAATFGNGIASACVVNMGAQVTSVVCVEDGVILPTTQIVLPFGGEDISRCLLWVQQRWRTWPPIDTNPLEDSLDMLTLDRIKETCCLIIEGDQEAVTEIPQHEAGKPSLIYTASLTALNVPVMGLFYPSLLAPEEYSPPARPGFHTDHEDSLDDSIHGEQSRRLDIPEAVFPPTGNGTATSVPLGPSSEAVVPADTTEGQPPGPDETALGLSKAIVNSILSTAGRPDLQKKLFASIQLVGGTARVRGLVDAVEERVLHDIPAHEAVDTVAVLQNRTDALTACWKGGAVLGILDFSRDAWVHHDEWVSGGTRVGSGRKYKDSCTLHSQAFYYSASVE